MFAEERYKRILEMLQAKGKVTVSELSDALQVSPVTARRDLEKLEERNLLLRTHGGAIPIPAGERDQLIERSFHEKQESHVEEKRAIAEKAASLVADGDSILLTPGTTNTLLASMLHGKKEITLVTNAANIAVAAIQNPEIDVILLGGKMRRKSYALTGPIAEQSLSNLRVDKLFLGVDGFDLDGGLTTPNLSEASINRMMIGIAREVIVVADHTKFGKVTLSHIAAADSAHLVVTDSGISTEYAQRIREAGIRLLIV
ncbi:DeoR/GlpR family DNA-binding transcription regulator [Paenibacillus thermoaerophilus]|uniref:DeoR/GlpR family DNA-binding transcription regulator n=1 Tax=Paenibacillus thermoaerophilus TaxID=1215385 RepID=A0ABW2V9N3_9BACL|nr:DeoR/GlpR family DNA-binding transcription regulator [Paenibacillus thermoaerophilus]TMV17849.1 DeoR/GlpR transcriptional regulator [Paenibacillus thermoaerophilus]